jgi:hypothetical protein
MQNVALQAFSYGKVGMLLVYKANNTMIELEKRDILKIGTTIFQNEGGTAFEFSVDDNSYGVQEIMLRNILKLFGDYEIVKSEDWGWDEEKDWPSSVVITTNLPWEEISKLHG